MQNDVINDNDVAPVCANGCTMLMEAIRMGNGEEEEDVVCELASGEIVEISSDQGSDHWVKQIKKGKIISGKTKVCGCEVAESPAGGSKTCVIPTGVTPFLYDIDTDNQGDNGRPNNQGNNGGPDNQGNNGRSNNQGGNGGRNLAILGDKTILVVRVVADGGTTSFQESKLAEEVFEDELNIATQYTACSDGKLNFAKASNRPLTNTNSDVVETDISNGVTTVKVSSPTSPSTSNAADMRTDIVNRLQLNFGVSPRTLANHVMLCLPAGSMDGIAYAYINHWLSVYSDRWCNYPSTQMHEIGHNLGLAHANENGFYKDQTGMVSGGVKR
jgi:hypothetical protein